MRLYRTALVLVAILLIAAALRIYQLERKSLWVDEFWSALLPAGRGYVQHKLPRNVLIADPPNLFDLNSARPIRDVWLSEQEGNAPPLYVMVMRMWGEALGLGPRSLRGLSVVASVAAVGLMFLVVRDLTGQRAPALWAATLMALAGPQIQYAQEARNYALLVLEGLGAAAALVRIEKRGPSRPREAALTVCVLAMALTHYFALGALVALAVYAAIRLRGKSLMRVGGCFAVAAILWGVLGAPVALRQFRNINDPRATGFLADDAPNRALGNLHRFGLLPVRFFTEPMIRSRPVAAVAGAVAMLALPLLAFRRREMTLWSLWLWLTVLPLLALDIWRGTQHLSYVRYALLASPALYAMVATVLADRGGWIRHLPPAVVSLACAISVPAAYEAWWKADWRALAGQIDRHRAANEVIIFYDHATDGRLADEPDSNFLYTSYYRRPPFGPTALMDRPPDGPFVRQLRESLGGALIIAGHGKDVSPAAPGARLSRLAFEPGAAVLWRAEWTAEDK